MVKKITEEQAEVTETTKTTEQEQQTPTPQEQLEALQAQLTKATEDYQKLEKGYKGLQTTVTERTEALKKQADLTTRIDELQETQKIFAAMLAERGQISDEEIEPSKKADYLKQYDEIVKRQKTERERAQLRAQQEEYDQRARDIYSRAEKVYGDDEDALHNIRNLIRAYDIDLAEKKVSKAETKTTDTKEANTVKESEEERINKEVEKRLREAMEKKGMLESETGGPSGSSKGLTAEQIKNMSPKELWERRDEIAKMPLGFG